MLRFFLLSNKICVIPCVHVCLNKDVSVIELICLQGREQELVRTKSIFNHIVFLWLMTLSDLTATLLPLFKLRY